MSDLVGTFISAEYNDRSQQRSFEQQKELQRDAQDYNTLMYNRSNLYNSPLQQMQRFKAAGLNPNLIYSQMSGSSASAPTMGAGSAPAPAQMQAPSLMETAQIGLLNSQKRNIDADTANKEKDVEVKDMSMFLDKEHLNLEKRLNDSNIELNDASKQQIFQSINKLVEETNGIRVDNAIKSLDKQFLERSMDDRVAIVKATLNKTLADAHLSQVQAQRITTLLTQELSNLKAEFVSIVSNTALTKEQQKMLAQQKIIQGADNYYLILASELRKNGNWLERNVGSVGAELVHMFTHLLHFSLK